MLAYILVALLAINAASWLWRNFRDETTWHVIVVESTFSTCRALWRQISLMCIRDVLSKCYVLMDRWITQMSLLRWCQHLPVLPLAFVRTSYIIASKRNNTITVSLLLFRCFLWFLRIYALIIYTRLNVSVVSFKFIFQIHVTYRYIKILGRKLTFLSISHEKYGYMITLIIQYNHLLFINM